MFLAGSVSKAMASVGFLCLVRDEYIGLDDPLNDRLHRWKVPAVTVTVPRVTLRQVLSHSAGLTSTGSLVTAVTERSQRSSRSSWECRQRTAPLSWSTSSLVAKCTTPGAVSVLPSYWPRN
jgi:CubicO group peptidase (beta-lactamase class C family)